MIFWDTSALLKAYVEETGTKPVQTMIRQLDQRMVLTNHVALEVLAGLARGLRAGTVTPLRLLRAPPRVPAPVQPGVQFNVFDVSASAVWGAFTLAFTHRRTSVGAMDLLHLAAALELRTRYGYQPFVVVSSDHGLLALAKALGLETFDPETEPLRAFMARYRRMSRNGDGRWGTG
ncbi:MAG TPA: PIN domain-containing protein [Longimicrobium sp.]|nr:PIN domain-containing protein [Longimicrobium sp.]